MTRYRAMLTAASLSAVLALGACGDDDDNGGGGGEAASGGGAAETVQVSETEYAIQAQPSVPAGPVSFEVANDGAVVHALEVEGNGIEEETEEIAPGETAALEVELAEGTYELYCPVGDHEERGMTTELVVGAGGGSGDDSGGGEDDATGDASGPGGY